MHSPERPAPKVSATDRVRTSAQNWIRWFGLARLCATAVAVVVIVGGGTVLLRAPELPVEAALPRTTGAAPVTAVSVLPTPDVVSSVEIPAPTTTAPTEIVVHVAGAVRRPGVYTLASGVRVAGAIAAAGGTVEAADPDALNLAAPLADGVRIYVPLVGEEVDELVSAADGSPIGPLSAADAVASAGVSVVDINRADVAALDALPGIGPATAQAIVDEREANGPFVDADALQRVPGIGPAKLEAVRDLISA